MLPLALKSGAGAEIYNGLAMAVVGGLSVATLFTLIFIPVVYTVLDDLKQRFWKVRPLSLKKDNDGDCDSSYEPGMIVKSRTSTMLKP